MQADDRLEGDRVQLAEAEEVVEHPGLDELRRLAHPDPIRESGRLDRGRQGEQVPVAFRQGRIDGHDPVVRVAHLVRDLLGDRVGQQVGRGDQDGAGVEFQDACARQIAGQAIDESDVA